MVWLSVGCASRRAMRGVSPAPRADKLLWESRCVTFAGCWKQTALASERLSPHPFHRPARGRRDRGQVLLVMQPPPHQRDRCSHHGHTVGTASVHPFISRGGEGPVGEQTAGGSRSLSPLSPRPQSLLEELMRLWWVGPSPAFPRVSGADSGHTDGSGSPGSALSAPRLREEQAGASQAVHPPAGQSVSAAAPPGVQVPAGPGSRPWAHPRDSGTDRPCAAGPLLSASSLEESRGAAGRSRSGKD